MRVHHYSYTSWYKTQVTNSLPGPNTLLLVSNWLQNFYQCKQVPKNWYKWNLLIGFLFEDSEVEVLDDNWVLRTILLKVSKSWNKNWNSQFFQKNKRNMRKIILRALFFLEIIFRDSLTFTTHTCFALVNSEFRTKQ